MNCINIKSPEFKSLAEATGIAEHDLDFRIAQWQEANNSTEFPTVAELTAPTEPTGPTSEDLNTAIKNFLSKIGVTYQAVESLTDSQGNPLDGVALANMLDKVIQVVEGKAGVDTLPEEAAHFFIEMLPEDSHLYTTMFNTIENYEVYKETLDQYQDNPLYKDNPIKLRKEAMAKLISKHIVDSYNGEETAKNVEKAQKWWNAVWNWITNKFKKFPTKAFYDSANANNAFAVSAEMIMRGDTAGLTRAIGQDLFLQTDTSQSTKIKNIILEQASTLSYDRSKQDPEAKKSGYTKTDPQTGEVKNIKNRVSDIVRKLEEQRNWAKRTDEQTARDKKAALAGDKIHAALNNIIKIYSEALQGKQVTVPDKHGVSDSQYQQLKLYAENLFRQYDKEFGPGTVFLSETIVYDPKNDRAGTVDLIAIRPDGTVDIYDWKSTDLTSKTAIPFYKEENWNVQLTSYKNILKGYGINKFGRIRVIPIATKFDKNMNLTNISLGGKNLEQVPITGLKGSDVEFTGDAATDKLIETLVGRLNKIYQVKVPFGDTKKQQLKVARIEKLKASIKELQLRQTYEAFLDEANFELNYIKEAGIENFDNDELLDARNFVKFYARIIEEGYISKDILKENFHEFSKVQASASFVLSQLNSEFEKRAIKAATDVGVENVLEPQEESGVFARWFRSISQFEHPVIKSFYRLVSKQKDKVYSESRVLFNKIESAVKDLEAWAAGQGLKGVDIYKPLLKFENGKWTGNLISKYKSDFYKRRDQALLDKDKESVEWLRANTNFDVERFRKIREENIAIWNRIFKDDKNKAEILKKKILDFDTKYDILSYPTTAFGKQNFLVTPKDIWLSDEYKNVMATPALKNFYELFTSTIKENSEYLDIKVMPSFVPSIHNDLIDGIAQNGFFSVAGMKDSFVQAITSKSDAGYGMIDETTGEFKKSIPVYYTQRIAPETKSMDLGRSLFLFGNMALNHKHMSEIESSAYMLKDILERRSKTIPTDALGKPIPNKLTEKVAQVMNSNDTLDMFNKFMDYYLYGISTTGADKTIQIKGNNVSTKKLFSQTLKMFSAKSLSLNVLSGFANLFGGSSNMFFEGVKGRFYTNKEIRKAAQLMSTKNEKAFQLIGFFDIESTSSNFEQANKLSASTLSKTLTFDKFYILQKGGDYVIENSVLLAMLQSHTLKDGRIVKKGDSDKSLMDQAEVVNDKIKITGLTEEEYGKFRRKVKYLYTTMKGNMSTEDINTVRLTVFGQAMMQFKNWIPRMADERFGNLRYTQDLDVWEQGKFITAWNHMSKISFTNFKNLVTGLTANGFLGIGSGLASDSIKKAAEIHYDSLSAETKAKMTREDYATMYAANLKASAMELQLIMVVAVLLACLKGWDDDEKDPARKYLIKTVNRNLQEISFFINPESAATMIGSGAKTTIPVMGFLLDIERFLSDFTGEVVGTITFDEERRAENKPLSKFLNLFPATNSLERLWSDLAEPEDKK